MRSPDKCVPVNVDGRVVMLPFSLQLLIPSVLGGLIGAVLLSRTDSSNFVQFVPWLVLVATVIIVLLPILVGRDETGACIPTSPSRCGLSQLRAFF